MWTCASLHALMDLWACDNIACDRTWYYLGTGTTVTGKFSVHIKEYTWKSLGISQVIFTFNITEDVADRYGWEAQKAKKLANATVYL